MRTTPLLATAWAGAATAAVGLGFFAVGLLDADPVPASATAPVTVPAPEVTPSASPSADSAPQVSPAAPLTGQQATDGGTVYGACADGELTLAGAPAAGWEVDDSSTASSIELKGGDRRIHVTATCGPTGPVFSVAEGGSGGDDDTPAVTPAPAPPAVTPAPSAPAVTAAPSADDHGGHGSDDAGPDDSGGRGSGGHGSDD